MRIKENIASQAFDDDHKFSMDFVKAQSAFLKGSLGDSASIERALQCFEALLREMPGHPLFLAYYGSSITLQARSGQSPWLLRIEQLERGLTMIDQAIENMNATYDWWKINGVPVSLRTLHVAIETYLNVPEFCCRAEAAKALLAKAMATPGFTDLAIEVQEHFFTLAVAVALRTRSSGGRLFAPEDEEWLVNHEACYA